MKKIILYVGLDALKRVTDVALSKCYFISITDIQVAL